MNICDQEGIYGECTSCQLCGAVCPKGAIQITLNEDGFYRPIINQVKCIDCGFCTKICYKFDPSPSITPIQKVHQKKLFSAWAKDDQLVKDTTSGGISDLLARQFIKDKYKVVGVIYNDKLARAEHEISSDEHGTRRFRGSKYIQSYTFDAFKEVVNNCKDMKYAVFGTPCQIYALNKFAYLKGVRNNFIFIDLYCHGCPSMHIWTKYQDHIKRKLNISTFDKVNFRSKIRGWGAFDIEIIKNGKTVFLSNPHENSFYELFFSDHVLNEGCHKCQLRGSLEYTDIRLGDFWGKNFLSNQRGVSGVSIASPEGELFFSKIKDLISYKEEKYSEFLPFQSWSKIYSPKDNIRTAVLKSLNNPNKDIKDVIHTFYTYQDYKGKIKRHVKNILYYLPLKYTMFLKRFL